MINTKTVREISRNVSALAKRHTPEILVALGVSGMGIAAISAVKVTPRALDAIEDELDRINDELMDIAERDDGIYCARKKLTSKETIRVCWKIYAGPILTGVTSAACIIGGTSINLRRNAVLATAYKISEAAVKDLSKYKENVIKHIGVDEHDKIEAISDIERMEHAIRNRTSPIDAIARGSGPVLFFETAGGQFFWSSESEIIDAINQLNNDINNNFYVSLNDFYDKLDLESTIAGRELGWNANTGLIDKPRFTAQSFNGYPVMVMQFRIDPMPKYNKVYG